MIKSAPLLGTVQYSGIAVNEKQAHNRRNEIEKKLRDKETEKNEMWTIDRGER